MDNPKPVLSITCRSSSRDCVALCHGHLITWQYRNNSRTRPTAQLHVSTGIFSRTPPPSPSLVVFHWEISLGAKDGLRDVGNDLITGNEPSIEVLKVQYFAKPAMIVIPRKSLSPLPAGHRITPSLSKMPLLGTRSDGIRFGSFLRRSSP